MGLIVGCDGDLGCEHDLASCRGRLSVVALQHTSRASGDDPRVRISRVRPARSGATQATTPLTTHYSLASQKASKINDPEHTSEPSRRVPLAPPSRTTPSAARRVNLSVCHTEASRPDDRTRRMDPQNRYALCSADTTTPTSCKKAGPAASTPTAYRNGYHPGGSTNSNDPNSTPESDDSTPNNNWTGDGDEHPTPHDRVS